MFKKLKKVDSKLFWLGMVLAGLWVIYGLLGIPEGYPLFIGIGGAFGVLLNYYIAGLFYFIAVDKGYHAKVYLWIAALFGFVGYLLIIAMPDRGNNTCYTGNSMFIPENNAGNQINNLSVLYDEL